MRSRVYVPPMPDIEDFSEEVPGIFEEIGRGAGTGPLTGECSPPMDVYETDDIVEIVMDLPSVDLSTIHVVVKGDAVLIAGHKSARRGRGDSSFHLVERGFGPFARSVRLGRSCDTANATATLKDGELRVRLPKIRDRRRRPIRIVVQKGPSS